MWRGGRIKIMGGGGVYTVAAPGEGQRTWTLWQFYDGAGGAVAPPDFGLTPPVCGAKINIPSVNCITFTCCCEELQNLTLQVLGPTSTRSVKIAH